MIFQQSKLGVGGFNLDDGLFAESTGVTVTLSSGMDMQGPKLKFTCKHYLRKRESVNFSLGMDMQGPKLKFTCKHNLRKGESVTFSSGIDMQCPKFKFTCKLPQEEGVRHFFLRDGDAGSQTQVYV